MNRVVLFSLCVIGALTGPLALPARGDVTLWYNGDLPSGGGVVNEESSSTGAARMFEDFTVTSAAGWLVDRVWSNDSMSFQGVTRAYWSIRSGMSAGNAGTTIASGLSLATQTPTGHVNGRLLFPEYTIEVSGLNVFLAPGTYWLCVSPDVGNDPINSGTFRSYASVTFGANAVGVPPGNNGSGFLYWPYGGYNYAPSLFNQDFSMGVGGVVVPEPSAGMLLLASGGLWLFWRRRKIGPV